MTTQRDLLAALVREFDDQDDYDWSKPAHESPTQEQRMADFLLARGVRVGDLHDCFWDPQPLAASKPIDPTSLHIDMTDAEAEAFIAAVDGHPYTCGYCVDAPRPSWRTSSEFLTHMAAEHPGLPLQPRGEFR